MRFISEFLEKWKDRKWSKTDWLICILGGILLLVIALPTEKDSEKKEKESTQTVTVLEDGGSGDYERELEKELEEILGTVSGAGKVKVMVTLQDEGEEILDKDLKSDENSYEEETVVYEKEDESSPYVTKRKTPSIEGVVVVAEGGANATVKTNLTEMVMALFSVEAHKVKIVPMDKE